MKNKLRILIIEDVKSDAELTKRELKKAKLTFISKRAETEKAFTEALKSFKPDIVLADYNLPSYDGISALEFCKEHYPEIPFIFVSGAIREDLAIETLKMGATDYVLKSHLERLVPVVQRALREYEEQNKRKQAEEEIAKSEAKYRILVENLPQKIFLKDKNSIYISCNENFARDLKIEPDEILGKTDFDFFPKKLADKYRADDKKIIKSGKIEDIEEKYIISNNEVFVHTVKTPIKDEKGKIVEILGIFWDITEQKKAEKEKEKMQKQLEQVQRLEAIGSLAGGISHDFNNLLTAISGYSELILNQLEPDSALSADVKQISQIVDKASKLVRQLLAFSKKQAIQPKTFNINEIVDNMQNMLFRLIGENIQLITDMEENPQYINADIGQIEQVIINLVINARDAMIGGGKLLIRTQNVYIDQQYAKIAPESYPGNFLCLSVQDSGIGMDPETLQHIFEPFFSTKGEQKGTGLGLSVVYGIISQHQGWISVYSERGKGTTFRIYLPALEKAKPKHMSLRQPKSLKGNGECVLIVEDDKTILNFAKRALLDNGYIPIAVQSVKDAMRVFEDQDISIDVLFFDVMLRDGNGYKLAQQLVSKQSKLSVLLTSGYVSNVNENRNIQKSGFSFIEKPYVLNTLLTAMRQTIENNHK